MRPFLLFFAGLILVAGSKAQTVPQKLANAVAAFEADSQMRHAILGFCVVDSKTGNPVYEHHSQTGLAPASTQKLFTSAAALELLGQKYQYATQLAFINTHQDGAVIEGAKLLVEGSGDPTLGSWRYKTTADTLILRKWVNAIKAMGIKQVKASITVDDYYLPDTGIPEGYIWQDIGNYYGAGTSLTNWHENQYDVYFSSRETGYPAWVEKIIPEQKNIVFENNVRAGAKGSGDNAYIFCAPFSSRASIMGTIPPDQKSFSISGAMPNAAYTLGINLRDELIKNSVAIDTTVYTFRYFPFTDGPAMFRKVVPNSLHLSPTLDSIVYWFLKRSINLYGEALVKTIGKEATQYYRLDSGLLRVKDFWAKQGIERSALHIVDGSGLSPQNRVTTDAMVKVLQYAKTRPWYDAFYYALPEYNGMKMKSGSIGGARAFAGYHTAKDGKEYAYAIIVNNYDGSSGEAVKKLYKVLDVLK
jgi:D-alanyl-D-alanine carboxypeptidase/D-alanyl-D-alanine-endopeptidase (penicillin-binding protein 4)